ncbi:glycosyltransferase family 4 protein [Pedobacter sp. P351]|uniref:glycosyltransferase family 4 protein n=1 Tax=Pedobacter superstes TaxID=3133441 RepID=UPI0030B738BD
MELKRKILIACDSSRSLLDFRGKLIEALLEQNEVFVFTPKISQTSIRNTLDRLGVIVYENGLDSSKVSVWSDIKYIISLYKVIKLIRPDVFFPYAFKPVIYGCLVANICGVKRITPMLTGLGYNFLNTESGTNIIKIITRGLLKLSLINRNRTSVILQNKDDYKTLLDFKIITNRNKAFVVNGSGVDLSHYVYSEPNCKQISFLMIARLINAKGVNEYYEAAKVIRASFPFVKCQLIGPYDDNIDAIDKKLYEKLLSGDVIEYLGQVDDVRSFIKESSVLVLPSYYGEGIPRCILEAMAMGRAVLTTNSVGCKETVNEEPGESNGFLVPVKNVSALISKMEYYVINSKDIIKFGIQGRRYAQEKFDVHKVNKQMLNVLMG